MKQSRTAAIGFAVILVVALVATAAAKPRNGGFETGDFTGWKTFTPGGGDWHVYSGKTVPIPRGIPTNFFAPPRGKFAAVATQGGPGLNILHRVLRLNRGAINKLSFFLAWDNDHNRFHNPNTFEFGGGLAPRYAEGAGARGINGPPGNPNQQFRIDIMKPRADLDSLRNRDILTTLFRTRRGTQNRRKYRKHSYNLTRRGVVKRRVRLRIAEVDNQAPLFVGIDRVKQATKRVAAEECPARTARC